MIGDGTSWEVVGKSGIHVRKDDARAEYRDGDRFELPLIRVGGGSDGRDVPRG